MHMAQIDAKPQHLAMACRALVCQEAAADYAAAEAVQRVKNERGAHAVLLKRGVALAWGSPDKGGDSSRVQDQLVDVRHIYSTNGAFASLKADGSVVAWGWNQAGGDCSKVQHQLVDVRDIYP